MAETKPDVLAVMERCEAYVDDAAQFPEQFKPGVVKRDQRQYREALAAVAEAFDTIKEGKRQWDEVAEHLDVNGDDVDAVIARAKAVSDLIAERDRLANIVRSHEAQIIRMTSERAELIEALEQSQQWIMRAVTDGYSQPSTAILFRNKAALARVQGGALERVECGGCAPAVIVGGAQ